MAGCAASECMMDVGWYITVTFWRFSCHTKVSLAMQHQHTAIVHMISSAHGLHSQQPMFGTLVQVA